MGDNLGSHQIGGFVENFITSNFFCRTCYKNDPSYNSQEKFKYRSVDSHNSDIDFALTTNQIYKGVKSDSVLNSLIFFHVCNPGLPPCIAHDLFEGVLQYDLQLTLNKLVKLKLISFETLNTELKNLHFSQGFNKLQLPEIKKSDRLCGSASQNLYLINIIPFALLSKLNELVGNKYWEFILILRQICNLVMSFQISFDQIALLKNLIQEYLEERNTLFENDSLKPKHHFLMHYVF